MILLFKIFKFIEFMSNEIELKFNSMLLTWKWSTLTKETQAGYSRQVLCLQVVERLLILTSEIDLGWWTFKKKMDYGQFDLETENEFWK